MEKELIVSVSSHAYNRDFTDKAEHTDMIIFSKKLIKLYNLADKIHKVGFYKFTDGNIKAVINRLPGQIFQMNIGILRNIRIIIKVPSAMETVSINNE